MKNQVFIADTTSPKIQADVLKLLKEIDCEFVPPLSFRKSTTERNLISTNNEGIASYFAEVIQQIVVVAMVDGQLAGMITFKYFHNLEILNMYVPCNYITTLGVFPEFRRHGIARSLYGYITENLPQHIQCAYLVTRTWSSNISHLCLLDKLGFQIVSIIKNDRSKGIDTLYYARPQRI